jgi:hypothetical protein
VGPKVDAKRPEFRIYSSESESRREHFHWPAGRTDASSAARKWGRKIDLQSGRLARSSSSSGAPPDRTGKIYTKSNRMVTATGDGEIRRVDSAPLYGRDAPAGAQVAAGTRGRFHLTAPAPAASDSAADGDHSGESRPSPSSRPDSSRPAACDLPWPLIIQLRGPSPLKAERGDGPELKKRAPLVGVR